MQAYVVYNLRFLSYIPANVCVCVCVCVCVIVHPCVLVGGEEERWKGQVIKKTCKYMEPPT